MYRGISASEIGENISLCMGGIASSNPPYKCGPILVGMGHSLWEGIGGKGVYSFVPPPLLKSPIYIGGGYPYMQGGGVREREPSLIGRGMLPYFPPV
jgi:hypothetical protein